MLEEASIDLVEASILLVKTIDEFLETPVHLERPPSFRRKPTFHLAKAIVHLDETSIELTGLPDDSTWPSSDLERTIDE